MPSETESNDTAVRALRHFRLGWWSLLVFLSLGAILETLHGFKVSWYVGVATQTRREMWTLAHAHGTLLGIIQIAFGATLARFPGRSPGWQRLASPLFASAGLLIPAGFFLGGVFIHGGDPGLGILLVPPGAVILGLAVLVTAIKAAPADAARPDRASDPAMPPPPDPHPAAAETRAAGAPPASGKRKRG